MTGYRLRPRARRDLAEVWDYSLAEWGLEKTESYLLDLRTAIETVAERPGLARPCDDIRRGYRRFRAGSHVIFFRHARDEIEIVRILNAGMDFDRRL